MFTMITEEWFFLEGSMGWLKVELHPGVSLCDLGSTDSFFFPSRLI